MKRREFMEMGSLGLGLAGLYAAATNAALAQPRGDKVIAVVARKFVFLPNEITVHQGDAVVLELTAPEVVMGFFAPQLQVRAVIVPGQVTRVRFVAERVGRYDFLCDIFCGDGHEGMSGHIIIVA